MTSIQVLRENAEFTRRLEVLKSSFTGIVEDGEFRWNNINAILMLQIRRNWTSASRSSNYQINADDVKDFFPILQMSDAFSHWRLSVTGLLPKDVYNNFCTPLTDDMWTQGEITYRHKIQNDYPYLQLTLEGDLRTFKNALQEDDQIFFLKEHGTQKYFLFAKRESLFSEDKILIIDSARASADTTTFQLGDVRDTMIAGSAGLDNIVLYGPPGTGKTMYLNEGYLKKHDSENTELVTFHQSYSYEEFIEGIKPVLKNESGAESEDITYEYSDGVFFRACDRAAILAGYGSFRECIDDSDESRKEKFNQAIEDDNIFMFCIDEINRANIPGVFGDLITLIEPNKRLGAKEELIISLPYSKRKFGVPLNIQIIATMNTADRSITLIETALRRRFIFKEIHPDPELLSDITIGDIRINKILETINKRIEYLLGKEQCIGHSYFLNLKEKATPTTRDLLDIFSRQIIPLLEEYFYNDYKKIGLVLGSLDATADTFFVENKDLDSATLFKGKNDDFDEKEIYVLNSSVSSLLNSDAAVPESLFKKIYE